MNSRIMLFWPFSALKYVTNLPPLKLHIAVSTCKVGDCVLQTYQTGMKLERATTVEFTTISPILYIILCAVFNAMEYY